MKFIKLSKTDVWYAINMGNAVSRFVDARKSDSTLLLLPDDLLIDIALLLWFSEYHVLSRTCNQFHSLLVSTDVNGIHRLNGHFKHKSHYLCCDILPNYKTKNWYLFYKQLSLFLIENDQIRTANDSNISHIIDHDYGNTKDVSFRNIKGYNVDYNPLLLSCKTDHLLIFQMLMLNSSSQNNTKINSDTNNISALYVASRFSSLNMVKYLLSLPDIDVTIQPKNELTTLLMAASILGKKNIVEMLVNHPTMTLKHINHRTKNGKTALYCAYCSIQKECSPLIIKLLIEKGADCNIKYTRYNRTILHQAIMYSYTESGIRQLEVIRLLCCNNYKINANTDVNITTEQDETALHIACILGLEHIVKILLDAGADPNIKTTYDSGTNLFGKTGIRAPIENVDLLCNRTPLSIAMLIGMRLYLPDRYHELPSSDYHYSNYNLITSRLIESNNYDLFAKEGRYKRHAMSVAVSMGDCNAIKLIYNVLCKKFINNLSLVQDYVNEKDIDGNTPYLLACSLHSSIEDLMGVIRTLLSFKIDATITDGANRFGTQLIAKSYLYNDVRKICYTYERSQLVCKGASDQRLAAHRNACNV